MLGDFVTVSLKPNKTGHLPFKSQPSYMIHILTSNCRPEMVRSFRVRKGLKYADFERNGTLSDKRKFVHILLKAVC